MGQPFHKLSWPANFLERSVFTKVHFHGVLLKTRVRSHSERDQAKQEMTQSYSTVGTSRGSVLFSITFHSLLMMYIVFNVCCVYFLLTIELNLYYYYDFYCYLQDISYTLCVCNKLYILAGRFSISFFSREYVTWLKKIKNKKDQEYSRNLSTKMSLFQMSGGNFKM